MLLSPPHSHASVLLPLKTLGPLAQWNVTVLESAVVAPVAVPAPTAAASAYGGGGGDVGGGGGGDDGFLMQ